MDTFEELRLSKAVADMKMGVVSHKFHQLKIGCKFRSEETHDGDSWYKCNDPRHSFGINVRGKITACLFTVCPKLM